jgi:hypothetical protein
MSAAACRKRGIDGQSEGELRKRQKKADDQQQSTEVTQAMSFVRLYVCSQRAHAFMEMALSSLARWAKPEPEIQTSGPYEAHA